MDNDIIQKAKNKGFKIAISKTESGFTRRGFKYRITDDGNTLMYAHDLEEVAYLTEHNEPTIKQKPIV